MLKEVKREGTRSAGPFYPDTTAYPNREDKRMALRTSALAILLLGLGIFGVNAQTGTQRTPSTVDPPAETREGGTPGVPKTTGAMENAVGGKATSPEDGKRQTEGKPTMGAEGKGEGRAEGTRPGITESSPGTVGASPGTTPPMDQDRK